MQLPGFIHSKTDEKDYELALHLDGHAGANYFCHFNALNPLVARCLV